MAKMFYTIEEAAEKLGKSEDEIREMASSGQVQEFRDRDKLMFKVDQIDLLAAGDEDTGDVHLDLEDTSGGSGLGLSSSGSQLGLTGTGTGTGMGSPSSLPLADSAEGTGISVFDTGHGIEDEDADQTRVGEFDEDDLGLEAVGSGSGLLDLTRESDDTSLGAELLEEVYSGEQDNIEIPSNASGLFEAAAPEPGVEEVVGVAPGMAMPMIAERYDGAWSGLGVGLMIGAIASLVCVALIVAVGILGATPDLAMRFAGNLWIWFGGLAGVTFVCGIIGFFIGKASE